MKIYIYKGDGACVPGLPLTVTEEDIARFTDEQAAVWQDALAQGLYVKSSDGGLAFEDTLSKPKSKTKKADDLTAEGD